MNTQHIISGTGSFARITELLESYRTKRIFLVCGKSFQRTAAMDVLRNTGIPITLFDGFSVNPNYEELCAGTELFCAEECDLILACGGGSAMDTAKCIRLFSQMPQSADYLKEAYPEQGVPLIAVPTTAGTGSESTRFAVIYRGGEKQSVDGALALPSDVILDAAFLSMLPYFQKACTMLDALCQAIESWWSVHSTQESIALAQQAVKGICAAMDGYLQNTADGNEQMLLAANLAGQAIHLTRTTAPHAMSYKLTKCYGFPHGQSVALALVRVWAWMIQNPDACIDPRGADYLFGQMDEIAAALECDSQQAAVQRLDRLVRQLGLVQQIPYQSGDAQMLARAVNVQRLGNHPVQLTAEELEALYTQILTDAPLDI